MKTFIDASGVDRTQDIMDAAYGAGRDPIHLLALLMAESSGVNPVAERYGVRTREAIEFINAGRLGELQDLINDQWADISFGPSQHIVLYHYFGDRSSDVVNVLNVRNHVFANTRENIIMAANKLAACWPLSRDGSALGAMVAYNAGSDRRWDTAWMARWSANVDSYAYHLTKAEAYRISTEEVAMVGAEFGVVWGNSLKLEKQADLIEEQVGAEATARETEDIATLKLQITNQIKAEQVGGLTEPTEFRLNLEASLKIHEFAANMRETVKQLRQSAFEIRESIIAAKQKLHME